jgi:endoglycosylceramidase
MGNRGLVRGTLSALLTGIVFAAGALFAGPATAAETSAATATSAATGATPSLLPLHSVRGSDARIADSAGRQVLLRGVDVDALGQYYQQYPQDPAVLPLTQADFQEMAELGFNVVRLVLSWSELEPTRGSFNMAYVARIRQAVNWAAANGIYVVLDMHQDAWGIGVMSSPQKQCPALSSPAVGYDGAPAWATYTDGMSTCAIAGTRELSLADETAWQDFYSDHAGIQDQLIGTWAKLAEQFAADPAVAGYDLLNEPDPGLTFNEATGGLGQFYSRALAAIRIAEQRVPGGFSHIAFFEPGVEWSLLGTTLTPQGSFTSDPNIVFAPHLYGGSLAVTSVGQGFQFARAAAHGYGTTVWAGEYGWYSVPVSENAADIAEFARDEDANLWGGAWWQWKQACGSPSTIGSFGQKLPAVTDSLVEVKCSGSQLQRGPNATQTLAQIPATTRAWIGRATVHAAPGILQTLASDAMNHSFSVTGSAPADMFGPACLLQAWVPGTTKPRFTTMGLTQLRVASVAGGFDVSACARGGDYSLSLR